MQQENLVFVNSTDERDEDLNINFKRLWMIFWGKKDIAGKIFASFVIFFVLLTFVLPKKYVVSTDLYINKLNNSNISDINPYVLNEEGSLVSMATSDKSMNNEMELMKSALVLDKVIQDNDIKYTKGKRKGEYVSAKKFYGKGKTLKITNVNGTNVISVSYKAGNPEFAYSIIASFIKNYIELHKELNAVKAQKDKALIEAEYIEAKEALAKKISQAKGLPVELLRSNNNLATMYSYSKSASNAVNNMLSQYLAGSESQIGIEKEAEKLRHLSNKLEWADMVEQMSDSSKVIVLNEPQHLLPSESSSPNLLINLLLGCLSGIIVSLITVLVIDLRSSKLTYSIVSDNVIFDGEKETGFIETKILSCSPKKIKMVLLENLPDNLLAQYANIPNLEIVYHSISKDFINKINSADKIIIVSRISKTDAETYRAVREIMKDLNKELLYDVLI